VSVEISVRTEQDELELERCADRPRDESIIEVCVERWEDHISELRDTRGCVVCPVDQLWELSATDRVLC
jgi:hypothetical protein